MENQISPIKESAARQVEQAIALLEQVKGLVANNSRYFQKEDKEVIIDVLKDNIKEMEDCFNRPSEATPNKLRKILLGGGENATPRPSAINPQSLKRKERRPRFKFTMVGIDKGEILYFRNDTTITCEVFNDSQVLFRGEITSLTNAAYDVLESQGVKWKSGLPQGPNYWCAESGKTLHELRIERGF